MYYGKIEAAAELDGLDSHNGCSQAETAGFGMVMLGLAIAIVGLPVLAVRLFAWAIVRDMRRVMSVLAICGEEALIAARTR